MGKHPAKGLTDGDLNVWGLQACVRIRNTADDFIKVYGREWEIFANVAVVGENPSDQFVLFPGSQGDPVKELHSLCIQTIRVALDQERGKSLHGAERRSHIMHDAVGEPVQFDEGLLHFFRTSLHLLLQPSSVQLKSLVRFSKALLSFLEFCDILKRAHEPCQFAVHIQRIGSPADPDNIAVWLNQAVNF